MTGCSFRRRARLAVLVPCLAVLAGCTASPPPPAPATVLRIAGEDVMATDLVPAIAESFLTTYYRATDVRREPGAEIGTEVVVGTPASSAGPVQILVERADTADAVDALVRHEADVVMSARPLSAHEHQKLGPDGAETVVARDAVVAVVHPGNPVTRLTQDQLRSLYSCRVTDWSQVGGPAGPIRLLTSEDSPNPLDVVGRKIARADLCPAVERLPDDRALIGATAADPAGIALVSSWSVDKKAKPGEVEALEIGDDRGAVAASAGTIDSEAYPLTRQLTLSGTGGSEIARAFVDHAMSTAGQRAVAEAGFVGTLAPSCVEREDYCAFVRGARRIPGSIWFAPGRSTLDRRGQSDIDSIKEELRTRVPRVGKVLVAGFADVAGPTDRNLTLSTQRADVVADQLTAAGFVVDHRGFGVIDDDPAPGERDVARRVMVWVTP